MSCIRLMNKDDSFFTYTECVLAKKAMVMNESIPSKHTLANCILVLIVQSIGQTSEKIHECINEHSKIASHRKFDLVVDRLAL